MSSKPTVREMVIEAVQAHGGRAESGQIRTFITSRYGSVNAHTINCQINATCVNAPARLNFSDNHQARICDPSRPRDRLFKVNRGQVEFYDPSVHGQWEIAAGQAAGEWLVRRVGTQAVGPSTMAPAKVAPAVQPAVSLPASPGLAVTKPDTPLTLDASELGNLRRRLFNVLDFVEGSRPEQETPGKRVNRLLKAGILPQHIGTLMFTILNFRNAAEYYDEIPTASEAKVILGAWGAVAEWASAEGFRYTR